MGKKQRPIVLSIAGFDTSGGAGILADIKTFENIGVYGMSVITALTLQSENIFQSIKQRNIKTVLSEINFLLHHYNIKYAKIGIIRNHENLKSILNLLHKNNVYVIWDPVLQSSSARVIFDRKSLPYIKSLLKNIRCITPNFNEALAISEQKNIHQAGKHLARYTNVVIKGGHNQEEPGTDYLYLKNKPYPIKISSQTKLKIHPKHGSGCVYSSALTAYLAMGKKLEEACISAKIYTEKFLASNQSLLGYHKN